MWDRMTCEGSHETATMTKKEKPDARLAIANPEIVADFHQSGPLYEIYEMKCMSCCTHP